MQLMCGRPMHLNLPQVIIEAGAQQSLVRRLLATGQPAVQLRLQPMRVQNHADLPHGVFRKSHEGHNAESTPQSDSQCAFPIHFLQLCQLACWTELHFSRGSSDHFKIAHD
jgi:hypothetical protein